VNNQLDADAGRVNDFDPVVDMSNPFDQGLRIESVTSIPDPDSPAPVEVETYHLVGPGRKVNSISGGIQSERDYGVPLIPPANAVIPAHAQPGDYILLLRVATDADAAWARNAGFEVRYSVGDEQFVSRWSRLITYCSLEEKGERFCESVGQGGIDINAE
jgi:hypothetical protein